MPRFVDYVRHGWQICEIPPGRKSPLYEDWNLRGITAARAMRAKGAGLLHALSGTCAIDIDHMPYAKPWLAERGIDLDSLMAADDAVMISSGRRYRAKLLYSMKVPLRTLKPDGQGLELRCASAEGTSVQDVLPGSIHPDTGEPYVWEFGPLGDWRTPPAIPAALKALWRAEAGTVVVQRSKPLPATNPELVKLVAKYDPDVGYEDWYRIGAALHHETNGGEDGFDIWDSWSSGGEKYKGPEDLRSHWNSFKSTKGKRVVTVGSLRQGDVAEADDFDIVPEDVVAEAKEDVRNKKKKSKNDAIDFLVDRLVFVNNSERYFDTKRHRLITTDNTIDHMFRSVMPKKDGRRINPVNLLKDTDKKRHVDALGFMPGGKTIFEFDGSTYANNWMDDGISDLEPTEEEVELIEWLLERIDDKKYRKYLTQFYGHVVQHPSVKINSAPLIWSAIEGNGKNTLLKNIPECLVGKRYSKDVDKKLLNSDFNDFLAGAHHISFPEFRALARGDRSEIVDRLKPWITDSTVAMNPKGLPSYTMPNYFFITASSNKSDAALINDNDRRWAVHELKAPAMTKEEIDRVHTNFFKTSRAAGVLRHYFRRVDLTGFNPGAKAPRTKDHNEMVKASASSEEQLLKTLWEERTEDFDRDIVITRVVADYVRKNSAYRHISDNMVARILLGPPFNGIAHIWRKPGKGTRRGIVLFNKDKWKHASGAAIEHHIEMGDDDDNDDEMNVDNDDQWM